MLHRFSIFHDENGSDKKEKKNTKRIQNLSEKKNYIFKLKKGM